MFKKIFTLFVSLVFVCMFSTIGFSASQDEARQIADFFDGFSSGLLSCNNGRVAYSNAEYLNVWQKEMRQCVNNLSRVDTYVNFDKCWPVVIKNTNDFRDKQFGGMIRIMALHFTIKLYPTLANEAQNNGNSKVAKYFLNRTPAMLSSVPGMMGFSTYEENEIKDRFKSCY